MALKKAKISRRRFNNIQKIRGLTTEKTISRKTDFVTTVAAIPLEEIVCLDETGFSNVGNAIHGYFRKGFTPTALRSGEKTEFLVSWQSLLTELSIT